MIVRAVSVWVKQEHIDAFEAATEENHRGSIKEPGVLRFDVLRSQDRPGEYLLCEVYQSDEAAEAHKLTSHYKLWRDTVQDWMEKPRSGSRYSVVCPQSTSAWRSSHTP